MRSSTLAACAALLALVGGASACHRVEARTPAPAPALLPPVPPARVVVPVILPEPEPTPPPDTPADSPAKRQTPQQQQRPPAQSSPPVTPPANPPPTETPAQPPVLQTTSNAVEVEQRTKGLLAAAQATLDRIDFGALTHEGRETYNQVKGLIRSADQALKEKNLLYANACADKAAALANGLVKRG